MKAKAASGSWSFGDFAAPALAAAALAAVSAVFALEAASFRRAVIGWATRDLDEKCTMAAASLREPIETGDFARIHAIGLKCAAEGTRLTVFSAPGGLVFDSSGARSESPGEIYATAPCGEHSVRLGMPESRVLAPFRRARLSFALAALAGGAAVMLLFVSTYRQRVKMRELARLEKFRRDFIADFSHELKTPLTGILGAADLLAEDPPAETRARLAEMVRGESLRLNALAQSILDLAKLERGEKSAKTERVDLAEVAEETVERFAEEAKRKGIALKAMHEGQAVVLGDRALLERAAANLAANALRHSEGKNATIGTRREGTKAVLYVEDDGKGIDDTHAKRVFERFYRVDDSRGGASGGSGLGLAIVRQIAELHNGEARLEHAKPHGCRFAIAVPFSG